MIQTIQTQMRFLLTVSLCFISLIVQSQAPIYQALLLDSELTDNANAIVRLDQMDIQINSVKEMTYTVRQVVTVLNKLGDKHARTSASYDKEKKIKNIELFVYDKVGKEITHIKKKDFQDVSIADGFSLYLDDRILRYRYTPVQYPYTIDFTYEVETSDTGVFPSWYFLSNYLVSVEKSRYNISYSDATLKPVVKEYNLSDINISKTEETGRLSYSADNIPAIKQESLSPEFNTINPHLALRLPNFYYKGHEASVNDWKDLGFWIDNNLLKGRGQLSEATINKAKDMVSGVADDLEKARIIYKYVQDNTRYVSVQIGIGGFQPISAIEVDRVKYGDCKGLSNYTKALLEAVGVTAYYTVIQAGNTKVDFDDDFADLIQGNHVILAIPYNGQYYWIDCTSQTHPFGFVGDFTDDRKALVITPNGGEIVRTVAYLNEQNYQKTTADYSISPDGNIKGVVHILTKGIQYDARFFLEKETKDDIVKHYKGYWDNINNLHLKKYIFQNDRETVEFLETVDFEAANYASISGDRILFSVNAFNKNTFVPSRYRNRKQALEISRGFHDDDEFSVSLPKGYTIEAIPDAKILETEFGYYKISVDYDIATNKIQYKRNFFLKQGVYTKEKYALYRTFRKGVASADNAQIVLVKSNL